MGEYLIHHVTPEDHQQRRPYGGGGGGDPLATLTTLKFSYIAWDYQNVCQPQFPAYCLWIKRCLLQGFPVMFRTKFDELFSGHIMPIVGIDYSNKNTYDERDTVYYYSLYNWQIIKQPLSELGSDPAARSFHCNWGCIPLDVSIRFAFNMRCFPSGVSVFHENIFTSFHCIVSIYRVFQKEWLLRIFQLSRLS